MKPKPGFRGGLGWEYKRFRFAAEAGFSRVVGTNPLVLEIEYAPLVFKFGYNQPIPYGFGVQGDIGLGAAFSRTVHYETVLDMLLDNLLDERKTSLITQARLYITWSPLKFLKIFAGGGIDIIFENEGPIPLPLIEAGISMKPFSMLKGTLREIKMQSVVVLYFEANSAAMLEDSLSTLDNAGRLMKDDQSLKIKLIGYYAPRRTDEWQVRHITKEPALATIRAKQCAQYLAETYGIQPERIKIGYRFAGTKTPELYRCVELKLTK